MSTFDLQSMEMDDLKKLRKDVDKAIASYDERRKAEARKALEEAAREHGFTINEIFGVAPRSKKTLPPKFAKPDDPSTTWSGKGRRPSWVVEHLDAGGSLDDLRI
jgi:DNA-binding protein H-NS